MTCQGERAAGVVNLMKTAEVNHYLLQGTVGHSIKAAGVVNLRKAAQVGHHLSQETVGHSIKAAGMQYCGNSKGRPIDSP